MKRKLSQILSVVLAFCMALAVSLFPISAEDKIVNIEDVNADTEEKIYFKCDTNKDPTRYAVGDEIVFSLTLYSENAESKVTQLTAPYFYYSLVQDDGISNYGFAEVKDGVATIRTKLSKAGGLHLTVKPCDAKRKEIKIMKGDANIVTPMQGGVIVGATEITTVKSEPSDFDSFWADQLKILDTCKPEITKIEKMTKATNPELSDWYYNNFELYKVYINCVGNPIFIKTGDTYASGVLTIPKSAEKGSLKLRLSFNGYGVSKGYANADPTAVMLTVYAHSMDPFSNKPDYYADFGRTLGVGGENYGWSTAENATPEGSYFRYMLLRDVQGVRFLEKYFGAGVSGSINDVNGISVDVSKWAGLWNGKEIETTGTSQGGFQAVAVAGLVPQVTYVKAIVPWLADVGAQTDGTRIASDFLPPYASGLLYYDTAFFASRVRGIVDITAGAGDTTCPMSSVQAIFNNLTTDATLTFVQGRGHSETNTIGRDGTETKSLTLNIGDVYTLPFDVKSVSDENILNINGSVLKAVKEGSATVTYTNGITRTFNVGKSHMSLGGDVNSDGNVDISDSVLLAQYLAEWDVKINVGGADCNGDGNIDISDSVLLAQYLAEWDVVLVGGSSGDAYDDSEDHDREIEASDIL